MKKQGLISQDFFWSSVDFFAFFGLQRFKILVY